MKPILCICLCLLSVSGFCQIKAGVQAGYNLTTLRGDDLTGISDYYYHASSQPAFHAGIISSIPLSKGLSLQPSLLLSEKGAKEKSGGAWSPFTYTSLRLYYAHLPVQIMYTFINSKQLQVSAGGGGFISKGIWGTSNTHYNVTSDSTGPYVIRNRKINFTSNFDDNKPDKRNVKSWDAGFTAAAAATWQNWQLKASYDFGAVKLLPFVNHRTGVFSLSAGYYFTKKKTQAHGEISKTGL